jgi:hypothetical protein
MFKEAGTWVPPVTVSRHTQLPENCCSSLFTPGHKRLPEGGHQAFAFGFWLFGCGRLLEGRIAGGRLLKEENEWLKGKELLKENC